MDLAKVLNLWATGFPGIAAMDVMVTGEISVCGRQGPFQLKPEWNGPEIAPNPLSGTLPFNIETMRHLGLLDRTMTAIVIYEEDDLMRALLKEWLSEAGYPVRAVASRDRERTAAANLVIASIYMPKQTGTQLVREIRAAHPGTPLIALSGQFRSGLSAVGATADALGVQQVIAKPLTRKDLLEAVRAIVGSPD